MSHPPQHHLAAYQDSPNHPLSIRPAPTPPSTSLTTTQILLKPSAWALNPAEFIVQDATIPLPFISYPLILGEDVAGTVIAAGSTASARFNVGDRVLALAVGAAKGRNEMGGFQEYVVVEAGLACRIPEGMGWTEGSVFPLAVSTAGMALFLGGFLGLGTPGADDVDKDLNEGLKKKQTVLVWGGSSAVGSNAIQLAVAAGYEVVTSASERNSEYVRGLGASMVFEYSSETVVGDLVADLDQRECVGVFQAAGSAEVCLQIAGKAKGDLLVVTAGPVPEGVVASGVRAKGLFQSDTSVDPYAEIGPMIFEKFLPQALARGSYKAAPEPMVLEKKGLEGIQEGLNILRKGVSARKLVVLAE